MTAHPSLIAMAQSLNPPSAPMLQRAQELLDALAKAGRPAPRITLAPQGWIEFTWQLGETVVLVQLNHHFQFAVSLSEGGVGMGIGESASVIGVMYHLASDRVATALHELRLALETAERETLLRSRPWTREDVEREQFALRYGRPGARVQNPDGDVWIFEQDEQLSDWELAELLNTGQAQIMRGTPVTVEGTAERTSSPLG
ncbi:hypothetical protein Bequi_13880 [Brachybacterium sp. JHP9]|uniref:Immunity protein 35 domain-containing protein n=1 Tax=Brachybacterium equifaecis TaxID=2910770 RepID=A0ABT0R3E5_9MICO|nr:hypothetical protein [Brachybacterium equifaecis]MCL6424455.1 hypothetical protein [Brachybacterium equifaecis]